MLDWSVLLFALSVVASLFGLPGIAAGAVALAKILFCSVITVMALGVVGVLLGGAVP
jgi:uncharacterized membrane protein YtjA (UPF0391 family)